MVILLGFVLVCAIWAVTASLLIARDLEKRGIPVSFFWLRLMIFKYLHQYNTMTRQETGRIGSLFYHYVVPLNLAAALLVVIAIIA